MDIPTRKVIRFICYAVIVTSFVSLVTQFSQAEPSNVDCHYRDGGALPDPKCTPGAVDHAVTQATIHNTICVPGWSTAHRPSVRVTEPEKRIAVRQYGYVFGTSLRGYEYDHLIPLELGGSSDIKNLWPEPHHVTVNGLEDGSYAKDQAENNLHRLVCAGKMKLWQARKLMRTDWRTGD